MSGENAYARSGCSESILRLSIHRAGYIQEQKTAWVHTILSVMITPKALIRYESFPVFINTITGMSSERTIGRYESIPVDWYIMIANVICVININGYW